MPLWDKVRQELDRAGRAAQGAIDEGKVRLEAFRARQLADRAAQALGYAVYRARQAGGDLDADSYARLSAALASRESEVERLEAQIREYAGRARGAPDTASRAESAPGGGASAAGHGDGAGQPVDEPPPPPPPTPPPSDPHQPL